jgi:hypothetical protein
MSTIAIFFTILTFGFWALGLYLSYDTEGGAIGMAPVLGYAVVVPLAGAIAAVFVRTAYPSLALPTWAIIMGAVLAVPLVGWTISVAGRLGRRRRQAQQGE